MLRTTATLAILGLLAGCGPLTSLGKLPGDDGSGDTSGTGPGDDGSNDGGDGTSDGGGSSDGGTSNTDGSGTTGSSGGSATGTQSTGTTAPPCEPIPLEDVAAGIGGFLVAGDGSRSVSMAGDVNGDGLADVIVGTPGGQYAPGRCYVAFGKADTDTVATADLVQGIGGFVLDGDGDGEHLGWSVSGAGDVNGDGLADVIVGAYTAAPGGVANSGRSYVVFGKMDTDLVLLADVSQGIGGFVMDGAESNEESGLSVSGAGDVNGDGLADVIVGAKSLTGSHRVYVVFGKTSTTPVSLAEVAQGTGGFALQGTTSNRSVSGAGDVNGDGLADVIVGEDTATGDAFFSGRSYVVFGKTGTDMVSLEDVAQGSGGFVMDGEAEQDFSGYSVSGAGDVNGDGLADVIVGAPQMHPDPAGFGRAYVVFGKEDTDAVSLADVRQGTGGFVMDGLGEWDDLGNAVSEAGDLNDDGLDDIIVGTLWDPRVYVVFGKADTDQVSLDDVGQGIGGFAMEAENEGEEVGTTVGGGGDVNGDDIPDLVLGVWNEPYTYVVFGGDFSCGGE